MFTLFRYYTQGIYVLHKTLLTIALFLFTSVQLARSDESFALVGGELIDGNGGAPIAGAVVLIKGAYITAVGTLPDLAIPADVKIINVDGLTLLPGLIDAHMHIGGSGAGAVDPREFTPLASENSLLSYLKFGVTTVYDMAAHPHLHGMKTALTVGDLVGPRLYGNGFGITAPGSHPMRLIKELGLTDYLGPFYFQVDTVQDAKLAVHKIVDANTDGIKIFHSRAESGTTRVDSDRDKLNYEVLRVLIEEAHAHEKMVYAHISSPSEAREFIEAGGDVIVHSIHTAETGVDEILQLMAARNVYYIPTLSVFEGDYLLNSDLFVISQLRNKVWDVFLDSVTDQQGAVVSRRHIAGLRNDSLRSLNVAKGNLRRAIDAGVKIVMGSDAGNAGMLHGATVIREFQLMKEAGMTPMQIIVAATKNGAEMIGRVEHLGTVEAGKLADIIVVNGHPLKNISDLGNVELVIQNGTFIDPKTLSFRQTP